MEFVDVPGSQGLQVDDTGYGFVFLGYQIGKYEVSRAMIDAAIASGMTHSRALAYEDDQPAADIAWYQAAIFVNWLNTSTGGSPAYKIATGIMPFELWEPTDPGYNHSNPYRNSLAKYVLPSENEWYKAAYYDAFRERFYDYATGSDSEPAPVAAGTGTGTAVFAQDFNTAEPASVFSAGGPSPFGTVGQSGNVFEMLESAFDGNNDSDSESKVIRGGAFFNDPSTALSSASRFSINPQFGSPNVGFRVVALGALAQATPTPDPNPEPVVDVTPPEINLRGHKTIETLRKRVVLRGTLDDASGISDLDVTAQGGKVIKVKIQSGGRFKAILKITKSEGRVLVKIRARDSAGLKSKTEKIRILRR